MYAVIENGGKQYRVAKGQVVSLEKIDAETGTEIELDKTLLVVDGDKHSVGKPYVAGHKIKVKIIEHGRAKKINIIKFNRRKHHDKQMGHRQHFTKVEILDIPAA